MIETWNLFAGTDIALGLLGAIGFLSMIVVIVTATGRVDKREKVLATARRLQTLEPEDSVLPDTDK
jgi:hypothetical protein